MKTLLIFCLCLAPLAHTHLNAQQKDSANLEQKFTPGKAVDLELEAGDYKIERGSPDKIAITSHLENASDSSGVHFRVQEDAHTIRIKVETPRNYSATIQLPHHVDLKVRLTAGDMTIGDLEGNKDIESHAGDLTINVGQPESYGEVDVSSLAGDIDAPAFHENHSGIGRSFKRQGAGQYRLHVHLGAGDIRLTAASPQ